MSKAPKVWVCKYVGKPGVNEVLKAGKNPIAVSSHATVGTYFKDGQFRSFVLAVQTDANTGHGNSYIGEVQCPTPTVSTTTTTEQVTTTTVEEGTTSTSLPTPSTTLPKSTTTVSSPPTTGGSSTSLPSIHGHVAVIPTASGATTSLVGHAPTLPFTGSGDVFPLTSVGLALVVAGVLLTKHRR